MEDDEVTKVNKEKITSCMKCPLCDELYTKATTISECLHTFCKKCIYEKLEDEEEECCPVCNTYLGVSPLEKLRPDRNKDSLKAKIFPPEGSQGEPSAFEPPEAVPPKAEPPEAEMPDAQKPNAEPTQGDPPEAKMAMADKPKIERPEVEMPDAEKPNAEPPKAEMPNAEKPEAEPPEDEMPEAKTPEDEKHDAELAVAVSARIKERPLSSLVVSTPKVSNKSPSTERRSRINTTNTARSLSLPIEKITEKEEHDSSEDRLDTSSSNDTLTKSNQTNSSPVEPIGDPYPNQETVEGIEKCEGNADLYEPLICLVEAANRSKSTKVSSEGSAEKGPPKSEGHTLKTKGKELGKDVKNGAKPGQAATSNAKKSKRNRKKKSTASGESVLPPQAVLDISDAMQLRNMPMWLSLVAAEDQEGDDPLPQISAAYLRIKDGDMPVSYLQKYLMKKLDLKSEEEVEIKCLDQPLLAELKLNSLLELWLQTGALSERAQVKVRSSADDLVIELTYRRKVSSPERDE